MISNTDINEQVLFSIKMVELLGKHCQFPDCNALDFLPIHCIHCAKIFCKRHGSAPEHSCESLLNSTSSDGSSSSSLLPCAYVNNCKSQKSPISFTCSYCLKNYCVEHRHHDDHQCLHAPKSTTVIHSTHGSKPETATASNFSAEKFAGTKNESLATKVALMKLKQTARGPAGIPMENRRHVFVEVDEEGFEKKRHPFYLSKFWPLGKALDYLTKELKLLSANRVIISQRDQTAMDLSTNIEDLTQLQDADIIVLKKS